MQTKSAGDKLSLIFYENKTSPRYFEIQKRSFNFALYGLPAIALLCLAGAIWMGVGLKRQQNLMQERSKNRLSREETLALQRKNEDLQILTAELQGRLAQISSDTPKNRVLPRSLFFSVKGQKDFAGSSPLSVENLQIFNQDGKTAVTLNLLNQSRPQKRIAGFLHLIIKTREGLFVWPPNSLNLQIPFNSGESFSTMRFRPVSAHFPLLAPGSPVFFWLISHNLKGDILLERAFKKTVQANAPPPPQQYQQ